MFDFNKFANKRKYVVKQLFHSSETATKKITQPSKHVINEKFTILALFSWNFVKMTFFWVVVARISGQID